MEFTHEQQLHYASIALNLFDADSKNIKNIEDLLNVGELIKAYASDENGVIYDLTEYLYEQTRLLKNEDGAYGADELRENIERELHP